jgi:hypothetical protein
MGLTMRVVAAASDLRSGAGAIAAVAASAGWREGRRVVGGGKERCGSSAGSCFKDRKKVSQDLVMRDLGVKQAGPVETGVKEEREKSSTQGSFFAFYVLDREPMTSVLPLDELCLALEPARQSSSFAQNYVETHRQ